MELNEGRIGTVTPDKVKVYEEMMREGVKQEIAWGQYVIGDQIQGLNRQMISDYIHFLGNLRWSSLGYTPLYEDNREGTGKHGIGIANDSNANNG